MYCYNWFKIHNTTPVLSKGDYLYIYLIASLDKWATLSAKNLLPLGANSLLEKVARIQEVVINGVLVVLEKNNSSGFSESSLPLIDQLYYYQYNIHSP